MRQGSALRSTGRGTGPRVYAIDSCFEGKFPGGRRPAGRYAFTRRGRVQWRPSNRPDRCPRGRCKAPLLLDRASAGAMQAQSARRSRCGRRQLPFSLLAETGVRNTPESSAPRNVSRFVGGQGRIALHGIEPASPPGRTTPGYTPLPANRTLRRPSDDSLPGRSATVPATVSHRPAPRRPALAVTSLTTTRPRDRRPSSRAGLAPSPRRFRCCPATRPSSADGQISGATREVIPVPASPSRARRR